MITLFSSTSYTAADYKWLRLVLQSGLAYYPCSEAPNCHSCEHKIACGDLERFYAFVSDKVDYGADRQGNSDTERPEREHC